MRLSVLALVLALLGVPLAAAAQQATKLYRVGYLSPDSGPSLYSAAFRQGLRDLGWVEGHSIVIEYRWAGEKRDRLLALATELVQLNVDIILAASTPGALAAKKATSTIPIVIPVASEPVATGLVDSLARPGGNVTGFSSLALGVSPKRLELLKAVAPKITRVAALVNPAHPSFVLEVREGERAAQALRLQFQALEVRDVTELERAFSVMTRQGAGGLIVLSDRLFVTQLKRIVDLAAQERVPTIHFAREFAEAGGLMAYGASLPDLYRRSAIYVDKILKGARPADLPVEQPAKFELVINMKTAKKLGLSIPSSLLLQADEVIQ